MIWTVLGMILLGLVAGLLGRLLVPGPDPMGIVGTTLLGIAGSFVGGFVYSLIAGYGPMLTTSGLIGSVLGAILLVVAARYLNRG